MECVDVVALHIYPDERLVVVKVCSMFCDNNRPSVWVDAGIHGNEWIGPATASYILKELVENSVDHLDMLTNFQWYFLPIFNPDGYAITMSNGKSVSGRNIL